MTRRCTARASPTSSPPIAKTAGLTVLGNDGIDPKAANYRPIAGKIKSLGADCFFYGGITQNNGVQLWKDVFAANPSIKLFGPDGVAESAFSEKIGKSEANTFITNPTLDPKLYPAGAQKFFATYKSKFGKDPEPYAIYGYEAMKVALLAIQNAGDKGNDRAGRRRRVLQDQEPSVGPRDVLHRRQRRHDAVGLRWKQDQERQARLRQGHQGQDVVASRK